MGFYGTAITDKALEYLATLPKLKIPFHRRGSYYRRGV